MNKLSISAKQKIIEKALSRDGRTLSDIDKSHNIGLSTLGKWLKRYRENGIIEDQKSQKEYQIKSRPERFNHLIATASLSETEIGVYCRENGLYSFQLTEWKNEFMSQKTTEKDREALAELKALRIENKQLKQEIRRKDSARAETTALLVLKKKAALIWGEPGDD